MLEARAADRRIAFSGTSLMLIDIAQHPKILKVINEALNFGAIVEVKVEKKGISVVDITRKVRLIEPTDSSK